MELNINEWLKILREENYPITRGDMELNTKLQRYLEDFFNFINLKTPYNFTTSLDFDHIKTVGNDNYYLKIDIKIGQDLFDEDKNDIGDKHLEIEIFIDRFKNISNLSAFNWISDFKDFDEDQVSYQYFCELRFQDENYIPEFFRFLKGFVSKKTWKELKELLLQYLSNMTKIVHTYK